MSNFTRANLAKILTEECSKNLSGSAVNHLKQAFAGAPARFGLGAWPYCGATVHWGCLQAGLDIPVMCPSRFGYSFALVEAWQAWGKEKGFYIENTRGFIPQPGDIGIIDWGKKAIEEKDTDWDDHVVTVIGFDNGLVSCAEGNAGNGRTGIFSRPIHVFEGFVRIPDGYTFSGGVNVTPPKEPTNALGFFEEAVMRNINIEGGFVNHPNDKGGPTNWGITQATLAAYRKTGVSVEDVRNLAQTEAKKIYLEMYWTPMNLGQVKDKRIAILLFDQGVNWGYLTPIKRAQDVLNQYFLKGLQVDGENGPLTSKALQEVDAQKFIVYFVSYCQDEYVGIVKRKNSQLVFLAGWINRTQALLELLWVA